MDLNEYLALSTSLSVSALRARMVDLGSTIKSDAQIRQWQHKYAERVPDHANCVYLELATGGVVRVESLRGDLKWTRIKDRSWPHPLGRPCLDPAKAEAKAA